MKNTRRVNFRTAPLLAISIALNIGAANGAFADVVGRLKIHVETARTKQPLFGVAVTLQDSAGLRPAVTLKTDARGNAVSPLLENRDWQIIAIVIAPPAGATDAKPGRAEKLDLKGFAPAARRIGITADTTTTAIIVMDAARHTVAAIEGGGDALRGVEVNNSYRRDRNFLERYPVTAGNPQDLRRVLHTVPRRAR